MWTPSDSKPLWAAKELHRALNQETTKINMEDSSSWYIGKETQKIALPITILSNKKNRDNAYIYL